jgi:hypothetical protein
MFREKFRSMFREKFRSMFRLKSSRIDARTARLHSERTRPLITVEETTVALILARSMTYTNLPQWRLLIEKGVGCFFFLRVGLQKATRKKGHARRKVTRKDRRYDMKQDIRLFFSLNHGIYFLLFYRGQREPILTSEQAICV